MSRFYPRRITSSRPKKTKHKKAYKGAAQAFLMPIMTISLVHGIASTINDIPKYSLNKTVFERACRVKELSSKFLTEYREGELFGDKDFLWMGKTLSDFNGRHQTERPIALSCFALLLTEDLLGAVKPSDCKQYILKEPLRDILAELVEAITHLSVFFDRAGNADRNYEITEAMVSDWTKIQRGEKLI